jgi:hypothetical protein
LSFDLFLVDMTADKDAALPPEKALALAAVVQAHGGPPSPDEHGYFFDSANGGSVELYAGHRDGGMLAVRGWGPGLASFAFDVLKATNWVLVIPTDKLIFVATRELTPAERETLADTEYEFTNVTSGADVMRAAEPAFGAWADYRDQVVKD